MQRLAADRAQQVRFGCGFSALGEHIDVQIVRYQGGGVNDRFECDPLKKEKARMP